jgi:hypothetical protein
VAIEAYGVHEDEIVGLDEPGLRAFFRGELHTPILPDEPMGRPAGTLAGQAEVQSRKQCLRQAEALLDLPPRRVLTEPELRQVAVEFLGKATVATMTEPQVREAFTKSGLVLLDSSAAERRAAIEAQRTSPAAWRAASSQSELDAFLRRQLAQRPPPPVEVFKPRTKLEKLVAAAFGDEVSAKRFIESARLCGPVVSEYRCEQLLWESGVLWHNMGSFAELQAKFGARPEPVGTISRLGAAEAQKRVDAADAGEA